MMYTTCPLCDADLSHGASHTCPPTVVRNRELLGIKLTITADPLHDKIATIPPFDIIVADPPWKFNTWSEKGKGRSPERYYKTMTLDALIELPVKSILADNAAMFLWATWPTIEQAFVLGSEWGFTYRTCGFVWVKQTKDGTNLHSGTGYYTRANTEPCLLFVKGSMPVMNHGVSQVITSPRREHSRKPDELFDAIETLYPTEYKRNRLELFARERRPGWYAWGNEVQCDPIFQGLP